jgi:hypothetical protein
VSWRGRGGWWHARAYPCLADSFEPDRHNLYQRLGWLEWFVIVLLPELTPPLGFISPQMGILGMAPVVGIAGMV